MSTRKKAKVDKPVELLPIGHVLANAIDKMPKGQMRQIGIKWDADSHSMIAIASYIDGNETPHLRSYKIDCEQLLYEAWDLKTFVENAARELTPICPTRLAQAAKQVFAQAKTKRWKKLFDPNYPFVSFEPEFPDARKIKRKRKAKR